MKMTGVGPWVLLAVLAALLPVMSDAAPSERDQKLLVLGALLGGPPMEILAWPQTGELFRLRMPGEKDHAVVGQLGKYDVWEMKSLNSDQLAMLSGTLLDAETFRSLEMRRPQPAWTVGRGAACMGGFVPKLGLRFRDAEERILEVLLSFTCPEASVAVVHGKNNRSNGQARHLALSARGSERLLGLAASLFPDDKWIRIYKEAADHALAPVPDLRISSDGRAVEVRRASDKVPVVVPVLDKCGDPALGPPKVRDVGMVKGNIVATYGKHCWATIDVTTLLVECSGCD